MRDSRATSRSPPGDTPDHLEHFDDVDDANDHLDHYLDAAVGPYSRERPLRPGRANP